MLDRTVITSILVGVAHHVTLLAAPGVELTDQVRVRAVHLELIAGGQLGERELHEYVSPGVEPQTVSSTSGGAPITADVPPRGWSHPGRRTPDDPPPLRGVDSPRSDRAATA